MADTDKKLLGADLLQAAKKAAEALHQMYPAESVEKMIEELWGVDPKALFDYANAETAFPTSFMEGFEKATLIFAHRELVEDHIGEAEGNG